MRKYVRPDGFSPLLTVNGPNAVQAVPAAVSAAELLKMDVPASGRALVVPTKTARPCPPLLVLRAWNENSSDV
jgi:hypothetical protein